MTSPRIWLFLLLVPSLLLAQESSFDFAATAADRYQATAGIVYSTASGYDNALDVYAPRGAEGPRPVVIYIHGGGWVGGSKETSTLRLLPYLRLGFAAVNVEYRMARNALAPAAVADCRCALKWVIANAGRYNFDVSKIVVTGHSAGGHLSLMTGMLDRAAGLDYECFGDPDLPLSVAAVVNFYGITDINDLLAGKPNQKSYAVRWLGSLPDAEAVARRASPLTYLRSGLPPILTIHGDADPTVPYEHAVRLHRGLDEKRVPNELFTVKGGKHGGFTPAESVEIQKTIEAFLKKHKVL